MVREGSEFDAGVATWLVAIGAGEVHAGRNGRTFLLKRCCKASVQESWIESRFDGWRGIKSETAHSMTWSGWLRGDKARRETMRYCIC